MLSDEKCASLTTLAERSCFLAFLRIASPNSSLRAPLELASLNFSFASFLLFQDKRKRRSVGDTFEFGF